jgi:hypothetical protein
MVAALFRGEYTVRPDGDGSLVTMRLELQAHGPLRPLTAIALRAAELRLRLGARRLQSMAELGPGDGFATAAAG